MFAKIGTALALVVALTAPAFPQVHVDGHYRSNGTYVQPHYRSSPNNSYNDNWSVKGNSNPYTGQSGTSSPTWNSQPPPSNNYGLGSGRGSLGGGLYGR